MAVLLDARFVAGPLPNIRGNCYNIGGLQFSDLISAYMADHDYAPHQSVSRIAI